MIILRCSSAVVNAARLGKALALGLQGSDVDLAILSDQIDDVAILISKLGDVLGAFRPSDLGTLFLKGLKEHHRRFGTHRAA